MDSNDARTILLKKPVGSYLVRFSGEEVGKFTLSVSHRLKVYHWRISRESVGKGLIRYQLENNSFEKLHDLLRYFQTYALMSDQSGPLFLTTPCDKNIDKKNLSFSKLKKHDLK